MTMHNPAYAYIIPANRGPVKPTPSNGQRHIPNVATPTAKKESRDTFEPRKAAARNLRLVKEAEKFFLGPMPVREFLDSFLPETDMEDMPDAVDAFINVPESPDEEYKIYDPFVNAINKTMERPSRCPGFEFKNTSNRGEHNKIGSLKPDICCYHQKAVKLAVSLSKDPKPAAHLSYAEMFGEVKKTPEQDFFRDPKPGDARGDQFKFILDIKNKKTLAYAEEALGQNVSYASAACSRQSRLFYFSFSLSGSHIRLIRWDRAGAIASESFDIRKRPELLCEFLWRFSHGSDAERGFDPTIGFPAEGDEDRFERAIRARVAFETNLTGKELDEAVGVHYQPNIVSVVNVVDASRTLQKLLISRPIISPESVASRATRGYCAVTSEDTVVFLKDTWRYAKIDQEGLVLNELKQYEVENIPEMRFHGDVQSMVSHRTRTQEFLDATWVCRRDVRIQVSCHLHYRIVLNTVGYSLKNFVDCKELLFASHDAYKALISAYNANNRLHRDISIGNILLVRVPGRELRRGILIDWEFSKKTNEHGEARDYERTGTWPFMSARILINQNVPHTIQDDMESILYVVLYCGLLWLSHSFKHGRLRDFLRDFFEQCNYNSDLHVHTGGIGKESNQFRGSMTRDLKFDCKPLHRWLHDVMQMLRTQYQVPSNWNPVHLAEFWETFMARQAGNFVEGNDRVTNEIPDIDSRQTRPYPATVTAITTAAAAAPAHEEAPKRKADDLEDDEVEAPPAKRSQVQKPEPAAAVARGGEPSEAVAGPSNAAGTQGQPVKNAARPRAARKPKKTSSSDVPRRVQPHRSCRSNTGGPSK